MSEAQASRPLVKASGPHYRSRAASVAAACSSCRKQKAKCSGERPSCRNCARQHFRCEYTTNPGETESQAVNRKHKDLKARAAALEEVFELLKHMSEEDAQEVLRRIRSKADIGTILNHIKAGDLLLQLSVVPETRLRYEFPYKWEMPEGANGNNPYFDSLIYEGTSILPSTGSSRHSEHTTTCDLASSPLDEYRSLYVRPFHAAQVVHPLLVDVKISSWTTVCDDDILMRDLLGKFLHCEYHFTAIFQTNLFLEDMAAKREDFCSSLLVNLILGYSCVCYPKFKNRAEYWNPHTLLYRFIAEAKRLWELQANEPRITTVQAGILFNVFYNLSGLDEIGQVYRVQSIVLAHQLRLFNSTKDGDSERGRQGRAFTAWALFNWETLVGFSFAFLPLLKKPPEWDLPDSSVNTQWYGEIWTKYPSSRHLLPSYFGQVFKARSEFRVIMNDFCQIAYSEGSEVTLDAANGLFSRLKEWFNGLSGPLLPRAIVLPGHLQLHMYFHHLVLTIYEPLLDTTTTQEPSPHQIVADAKEHLQTLVRLYYLRHGFEAMDLFIVIPLMLTASDIVEAINEEMPLLKLEALRSTLILVVKGLYDQRRNHYLAEALYRVIRGRMRSAEVVLLRGTMKSLNEDESAEKREMVQAVRSHWPVSVVKKKVDMHSHVLKNLVESYAHLNIEDGLEKDP